MSFKIELKVTNTKTGMEIEINETFGFFHMETKIGVRTVPDSNPPFRKPSGKTKTEIVFGNGIKSKDDTP